MINQFCSLNKTSQRQLNLLHISVALCLALCPTRSSAQFWNDNLGKDISESGYLVFYFGGNMSEGKSYWSSYKVSGQSKEIGAS